MTTENEKRPLSLAAAAELDSLGMDAMLEFLEKERDRTPEPRWQQGVTLLRDGSAVELHGNHLIFTALAGNDPTKPPTVWERTVPEPLEKAGPMPEPRAMFNQWPNDMTVLACLIKGMDSTAKRDEPHNRPAHPRQSPASGTSGTPIGTGHALAGAPWLLERIHHAMDKQELPSWIQELLHDQAEEIASEIIDELNGHEREILEVLVAQGRQEGENCE